MVPSYLSALSKRNTNYNLRSSDQQQLFIEQHAVNIFKSVLLTVARPIGIICLYEELHGFSLYMYYIYISMSSILILYTLSLRAPRKIRLK